MPGAYEEAVTAVSLNAAADHSGENDGLYRFVIASTTVDGEFVLAGAAARAVGVLLSKPPEGQPGRIGVGGIVPIELGGSVTRGGEISSGADGVGIAQSSTNPSRAIALASGSLGEIIPALLLAQR